MASATRDPMSDPATVETVAAPVLTITFGFSLVAAVFAGAAHPAAGMAVLVAGLMATGVIEGIFRNASDPVGRGPAYAAPPARKLLAPPPLPAEGPAELPEDVEAASEPAPARKPIRRKPKPE